METMLIARTLILLVGLVHGSALMAVAQLPEPDPVFSGATAAVPSPFPAWLQGVREEALARGISAPTVAAALADITPVEQILNRDRTQAEFKETLDEYIARRIGVPTIRLGRQMRDTHRPVLEKVAAAYKVPPHVLVAVWGLESNFGRFSGVRPLMPTLATLAYDDRRGADVPSAAVRRADDPRRRVYRPATAEGLVGGRDGAAAVHAVELPQVRRRLRCRRAPRHLVLASRRVRLDRQLPRDQWLGARADVGTRGHAAKGHDGARPGRRRCARQDAGPRRN